MLQLRYDLILLAERVLQVTFVENHFSKDYND